MGGPKKGDGEKIGYDQSQQNRDRTNVITRHVDQNNSQFNGPVEQTPYYKSLLQAGTASTNQAYDNANRNLRMSMEGAGISGASGAVAGNTAALGASRAASLGDVGTHAVEGATGMQMNANQQALQEAGMYSGAGLGYYSGANQQETERLKNQGSLWKGLLQAGAGIGEAALLA